MIISTHHFCAILMDKIVLHLLIIGILGYDWDGIHQLGSIPSSCHPKPRPTTPSDFFEIIILLYQKEKLFNYLILKDTVFSIGISKSASMKFNIFWLQYFSVKMKVCQWLTFFVLYLFSLFHIAKLSLPTAQRLSSSIFHCCSSSSSSRLVTPPLISSI